MLIDGARAIASCLRWVRALHSRLGLAGVVIIAIALSVVAPLGAVAWADPTPVPTPVIPPIPVVDVGDTIINPDTGLPETVTTLVGPDAVITSKGNAILLADAVGQTFTGTAADGVTPVTYTVTAVTPNAINPSFGATSLTLVDASNNVTTATVVTDESAALAAVPAQAPSGGAGSGSTPFVFPTATGDVNNVVVSQHGGNGSNGNDGFGIRICFFKCFTIGVPAGDGGGGGNAPDVNSIVASSHGPIETVSDNLPGIVFSSVGGDGGRGGNAYLAEPAGHGGDAGLGGSVNGLSDVTIITSGANSYGVFAQSRSGVGGHGGSGFIFSEGGAGGAAPGQGGAVTLTNFGNISTSGSGASAIFAQSLGGAAGSGGSSFGIVGEPGQGSIGGVASDVNITNGGVIVTGGDGAAGLQGQSIGGSGGSSGTGGGLVTFGSNGAAGGSGGGVGIINLATGSVTTHGVGADAIFAQSIGGGGGNAGVSGGVAAFGGSGGGGGSAASVSVENDGAVLTTGADSRGIFAQSVGGGGGSADGSGGLVSLGGSGSGGGNGASVSVTQSVSGSIITKKVGSDGIFAQSVGGGGGAGSGSGGVVSLGGSGGGGGQGGSVSVANAGTIETSGDESRGIFAQSVGGGGGSGGSSGGLVSIGGGGSQASTGGDVVVANSGYISTGGNTASAIQAQSIGGGGGDGGSSGGIGLSVGGSGGGGGNSGVVTVGNSGDLLTNGNYSNGIFAQAIGGGGGNGGGSASGAIGFGGSQGGGGGGGGQGGRVNISEGGATQTNGDYANGMFAQSVGGGGGNGGFTVSGAIGGSVALGGSGGNGGSGGLVCINADASCSTALNNTTAVNIQTAGDQSNGIFAQSVGGGGGNGGFAIAGAVGIGISESIAMGGTGGKGGQGSTVLVGANGQIQTEGMQSNGIEATSIGGGGGNGGFSVAASRLVRRRSGP